MKRMWHDHFFFFPQDLGAQSLFTFCLEYTEVGDNGVSVFLVHRTCRRYSHCSRSLSSEPALPV